MRKYNRNSGFTITELMMVVAILGILAAIAIPSFTELIRNNRRTVVVNELMANLISARAEAVKRGQPVIVCGINDADNDKVADDAEVTSCSGADWRDGWMLALWDDANNNSVLDNGELVSPPLRTYMNDYADITVTTNAFANAPAAGVAALQPFSQSSSNGTITICDQRGAPKARQIVISRAGRAKSADGVTACP